MPELPEVEAYRSLAVGAVGRRIDDAVATDVRFVRGRTDPHALSDTLVGARFVAARRHGKLLVLDVEGGAHLGLRFGMTGRLVLDGAVGVDRLVYSSDRVEPAWDRFVVSFADGGQLVVRDPRLLGGVELDPDEASLGPDALTITPAQLRAALAGSSVAVKSRLMDQRRVAGVGNLIGDEVLWRAGLAPERRAGSLSAAEHRRLHRHLRTTLDSLIARGGSHTGDLMPERRPEGHCPRDGALLMRTRIGGRTSWWCPRHQH